MSQNHFALKRLSVSLEIPRNEAMYVNGIRWKSCGSFSSNIRYLSVELIICEK
jgi:hypothetical protein